MCTMPYPLSYHPPPPTPYCAVVLQPLFISSSFAVILQPFRTLFNSPPPLSCAAMLQPFYTAPEVVVNGQVGGVWRGGVGRT